MDICHWCKLAKFCWIYRNVFTLSRILQKACSSQYKASGMVGWRTVCWWCTSFMAQTCLTLPDSVKWAQMKCNVILTERGTHLVQPIWGENPSLYWSHWLPESARSRKGPGFASNCSDWRPEFWKKLGSRSPVRSCSP